ncbi:MAG: stage II sporulation protein R [Clostridia bacterium]
MKEKTICMLNFLIVLMLLAVLLTGSGTMKTAKATDEKSNILRLHIIANSDGVEDQRVKLAVRDAILNSGTLNFSKSEDAMESERKILTLGAALEKIVENTLFENGAYYLFEMRVGKYDFPDKTYGNVLYKAGEYEALRIILGDGGGKNWWCVIYPPLCIVNTPDEQTNGKSEEREFKSLFAQLFDWLKEVFKSGNEAHTN